MEVLNSKDVNELENFLQVMNEKVGYLCLMLVSDDGLIILSSNSTLDQESIAAMAANLFSPVNIFEFDLIFLYNPFILIATDHDLRLFNMSLCTRSYRLLLK